MTPLMNLKDSARLLAISVWTLRSVLRKGKLHPVRIGRRILLEQEELERFIQESKAPDPGI